MNFKLSEYQQNILDYVKFNKGNLLIDAKAGSGKTSTLVLIASELMKNNEKCMFLSFNKSIVDDPGVGTYYPNDSYVKKKTISFSFEKKPRKLENYKYCYYKDNNNNNKNKSNNILLLKRKIKNYNKSVYEKSLLNKSNVSFDWDKNIKIIRDVSSKPKKKIDLNNISSYSFYLKHL